MFIAPIFTGELPSIAVDKIILDLSYLMESVSYHNYQHHRHHQLFIYLPAFEKNSDTIFGTQVEEEISDFHASENYFMTIIDLGFSEKKSVYSQANKEMILQTDILLIAYIV